MNNNTTNLKSVKAPQATNVSQPAANKAAVGCGCGDHGAAKHQGHQPKNNKR